MNNIQDNVVEAPSDLPLVSVGIPTYNRPEGVRKTLECITGQTYTNLEIIVSDNCSPGPETEGIVREFMKNDRRIQYYRQKKNEGSFYNFQFIFKKANGEFFMWAADDDKWEPFFIEKVISMYHTLNDRYIAITLEAQYINQNEEKMDFFPEGSAFYDFESQSAMKRLQYLLRYNYGNLVYSIFRMRLLKKNNSIAFFENEIPFMLQVMQYGNWKVMPEIGWYKKTNSTTYKQAKWEICGGWHRKYKHSYHQKLGESCYSMRYHMKTLINIIDTIYSLNLPSHNKFLLLIYAYWILSIHQIYLIIGYKKPLLKKCEEL